MRILGNVVSWCLCVSHEQCLDTTWISDAVFNCPSVTKSDDEEEEKKSGFFFHI